MRTIPRRLAHRPVALLAGATLLWACGGDDTATTPNSAGTPTRATADSRPDPTTAVPDDATTTTTDRNEAAANSAGESETGTAASDPCALLTVDDIATALDVEADHVPDGTRDDFNGVFPGCAWGEYVKVYVGLTDGWMDSDDTEPITGLGDRASYDGQWHRVAVQSDGERFFVVLGLLASGDDLTMLRPLAHTVIANLSS